MLPNPDYNPEPLEEAVDEALEGAMRARELEQLIAALRLRRDRLTRDLSEADDPGEREIIEQKLEEIDGQIQILAEEASINRFIEETARFSYEVRRLSQG